MTIAITITEPTPLTVAAAGFNVTCYGVCDGQIVAIPNGGTPNYTFAWSTGCTQPSCNNVCAGTYNITVTDMNGCTTTASATVTQPTQITYTTSSQNAHCNQPDGCVDIIPSGGTGSLSTVWTSGPSTGQWCGIIPGSYVVTVTDANGCDTTATVVVGNIPGVLSNFVASTMVTCNGACDGSATCSTSGGTGTITYAWTPSGGTGVTANNLCNGTYTFTATDSAGCVDTTVVTITQPAVLNVTALAAPTAVCAGSSLTVTASSTGGTPTPVYTWPSLSATGASQTYVPTASGPVTVIVTDGNGCIDSTTVNITVDPIPAAGLVSNMQQGCEPLCILFSDISTITSGTITSWSWDFGDGNTSTQQNPQHCYTAAGVYSVTLTVTTAAGCTNTIVMTNYINVWPNPVASFTAGPQPTTELDPTIFFTDASTGADSWLWSFGDSTLSSTLQNPSYTYPGPGCYNVVLTVSTTNGCSDTAMQLICIDPDVTLFVPNAFTPNDDGKNDLFFPQGIGIDPDKYELWIFDRWGNLIFYTDDFAKGWDGRVQGHDNPCQIDTYVWKIKAVDLLGHKHNLIGKVSLIR
jgi:gliding motility-associated-like protein